MRVLAHLLATPGHETASSTPTSENCAITGVRGKTAEETAVQKKRQKGAVIRMRRMNHIEREQLISLPDIPDMFYSLRVTGLFFIPGTVFPFFTQNDSPFFFPLSIVTNGALFIRR
ncbi:TPA: hypothetical protein UZ441_004620 [Escherichia coli]|nr:hypothetical protein [Escherichia coli]HEL8044538.1 hypothetical protein [Escherichia coli]HEL8049305.1 hypothetical protein [Escherichia coli]HEL8054067.1 hypothetical protein [Escherichia coli]HEL8058891.1 hypothetical protein [Escherichia coli]